MEPRERIPMINACARTLSGRGWSEIDFLLSQFNLPNTDNWRASPSSEDSEFDYVRDMLGGRDASDENIFALHDYLHGTPTHDLEDEPWGDSSCRVFITHLWDHREDALAVKEALLRWGVDGFVAHRDINPGTEWVRVIVAALHSCNALVALLHNGFKESDWCDQEVGIALGKQVAVIPVRIDFTPYGLLGSFQAISWVSNTQDPAGVFAVQLIDLLLSDKRTEDRVIEALVQRFVASRSFDEANRLAKKLESVAAELSMDQVTRCVEATNTNGQVAGAWTAQRLIKDLSDRLPTPIVDSYGPDEAPF